MTLERWFLPDTPDVLGHLRAQIAITIEGLDSLAAWARGDAVAAERVRDADHRGDAAKRELLEALRAAFVTPMEPEDLFALSRGVDWVLAHARDVIREAEVMAVSPDSGIADMAALLSEAMRHLDDSIACLGADAEGATRAADAAIESERALERTYYEGMAALLELADQRERITRRELYRRCARIGETVVDVADRVIYAIVKES
jgi:uncharacterized protein